MPNPEPLKGFKYSPWPLFQLLRCLSLFSYIARFPRPCLLLFAPKPTQPLTVPQSPMLGERSLPKMAGPLQPNLRGTQGYQWWKLCFFLVIFGQGYQWWKFWLVLVIFGPGYQWWNFCLVLVIFGQVTNGKVFVLPGHFWPRLLLLATSAMNTIDESYVCDLRFWATSSILLCQTRVRVRWRQSLEPHCASRSSRSGRQLLACVVAWRWRHMKINGHP